MPYVVSSLENALIKSGQAQDIIEAREIVYDMRERVFEGEDPEEVLYEYGLEPDYVFDILPL